MKTLITARFDKEKLPLLESITTDYSFAGYGVTGIKMPVPEMKEAIKGWENELKFANTHKDTKYEKYCQAMIKLCSNTLNRLQDDFKHLI